MAKKATRLMRDAVAARYAGNKQHAYNLVRQAQHWAREHYQPRLEAQARRLRTAWEKADAAMARMGLDIAGAVEGRRVISDADPGL